MDSAIGRFAISRGLTTPQTQELQLFAIAAKAFYPPAMPCASVILLRTVYDMWHLADDEESYTGGFYASPMLQSLCVTEC